MGMVSEELPGDFERDEVLRLKNVLKQAISRNKAGEKVALWKQKNEEDHGSAFALSLKSNDGEVIRKVPLIPEGAQVTQNNVNTYEDERRRAAAKKEDILLDRLCDGKDTAWRPDSFFSESLGEDDLPWRMRPTDFFKNRTMVERVVTAYEASRSIAKKEKKKQREREKKKKKKDAKEKKKKKRKLKDQERKEKEIIQIIESVSSGSDADVDDIETAQGFEDVDDIEAAQGVEDSPPSPSPDARTDTPSPSPRPAAAQAEGVHDLEGIVLRAHRPGREASASNPASSGEDSGGLEPETQMESKLRRASEIQVRLEEGRERKKERRRFRNCSEASASSPAPSAEDSGSLEPEVQTELMLRRASEIQARQEDGRERKKERRRYRN